MVIQFLICSILCVNTFAQEISYLQVSSEEINSKEFGITPGTKETTCPCGYSNKGGNRIVGGKLAQNHEFPFAAGIIDKYTGFLFCGGALISRKHVVTGAHCTWRRIAEKDPISVVLGENDVTQENKKIVDVARVIHHQNFNKVTLLNDIALMVLSELVEFNKFIGPVCLPTERKQLDHKTVRIVGWGSISQDGPNSPKLKKVNVRVVPLKTCSFNYPGAVLAPRQSQICTFARRQGSCQGDSGGPVLWVDPETNRYTLLGVVSFGKGCATTVPTVNTDVFAYIDWIKNGVDATGGGEKTCAKV